MGHDHVPVGVQERADEAVPAAAVAEEEAEALDLRERVGVLAGLRGGADPGHGEVAEAGHAPADVAGVHGTTVATGRRPTHPQPAEPAWPSSRGAPATVRPMTAPTGSDVDAWRAAFAEPAPATVGAEEELTLVDPDDLAPRPAPDALVERIVAEAGFKRELSAAQIESLTPACASASAVAEALAEVREQPAARRRRRPSARRGRGGDRARRGAPGGRHALRLAGVPRRAGQP